MDFFEDPAMRSALIVYLLSKRGGRNFPIGMTTIDSKALWNSGLDMLAKAFREYVDLERIYRIIGLQQ